MVVLPKRIIRLDDGVEFVLNHEGKYVIKISDDIEGNWSYSYEQLMEYPNNKGFFKVADGTEDLEAMKRDWIKRTESHNDGHGEDDCDCGKGRE
jgi:hypothetical protein